jgi:hypothetical protein
LLIPGVQSVQLDEDSMDISDKKKGEEMSNPAGWSTSARTKRTVR